MVYHTGPVQEVMKKRLTPDLSMGESWQPADMVKEVFRVGDALFFILDADTWVKVTPWYEEGLLSLYTIDVGFRHTEPWELKEAGLITEEEYQAELAEVRAATELDEKARRRAIYERLKLEFGDEEEPTG